MDLHTVAHAHCHVRFPLPLCRLHAYGVGCGRRYHKPQDHPGLHVIVREGARDAFVIVHQLVVVRNREALLRGLDAGRFSYLLLEVFDVVGA